MGLSKEVIHKKSDSVLWPWVKPTQKERLGGGKNSEKDREKGVIEVDEAVRPCPVMENKDKRPVGSREAKS